ncbi:MAG: hypothetical protein AAGG44_04435 [Planctomycetota bacterium]
MSPCPTCGRSQSGSTAGKIVFALLGVCAAVVVGIPLLIIVCLTAISAIGTSANEEFDRVSAELSQVESQSFDSYATQAVESNPAAERTEDSSQDFIYTSANFND